MIILSVAAVAFRRHWTSIIYVSLYPAVLLFWKIPHLIYRTRSWIVFLGAFNLAASFFRDFKFNIVSKTLATIAALVALLSTSGPTTTAALIVLHGILAWITFRTVKFSLTPSRFLLLQRKFIDRTSEGAIINQITSIKPELQDEGVEKFDRGQFTTFHTTLSVAVLWHKGIYFWAYQLERYRQSATLHVFGLASYLWLFLQTVFVFSLTNYALLRIIPSSFNFEEKPTYVKIFWYSLSSLFVNGIDGLSPRSDLAIGITIFAGFAGPFILAVLVLHFIQSVRQARQDADIRAAVGAMKDVAHRLDDRLRVEYGVGADEAFVRLQSYGRNLISGVIEFVALRIPSEFESGGNEKRDENRSS